MQVEGNYITQLRDLQIRFTINGLSESTFPKITYNAQITCDLTKTRDTLIPKILSRQLRLQIEEMEAVM